VIYKSSSDIQQGSSISSLKSLFSKSCQGHAVLSEDTFTSPQPDNLAKQEKISDVTPHEQQKGVCRSGHRIG
jgi:hypothetical protein